VLFVVFTFSWFFGEEEQLSKACPVCPPSKTTSCKKCAICDSRPIVFFKEDQNGAHQYSRFAIEAIDPLPIDDYTAEYPIRKAERTKLLSLLRLQPDVRRVYIDLGSGNCNGTMKKWFGNYPQSHTFELYAFEAHPIFAPSYKAFCPEVEFHSIGVYTKETKIKVEGVEVQTIDIAAWLKDTVKPEDFVVMRMDIGGSEPLVVAHMKQQGVLFELVDELFLECHYFPLTSRNQERTRQKCVDIFTWMRQEGLYVHEWF